MTPLVSAVVFLALLLLAVVIWIAIAIARSPYSPAQSFFAFVNVLLTRLLWRTQAPDHLALPHDRGAVMIANHRSSVDPFFIQLAARRMVHWMVAAEFVHHPGFSWFLKTCEVIPVRRGGVDTAATKQAIRYLKEGGIVGMLPEGRINEGDDFMLSVRPGAVMIALKARAAILPLYIEGAPYGGAAWTPLLMPARVRVKAGELIDLSEYPEDVDVETLRAIMTRCIQEIARLAGIEDYQPEFAGRNWLKPGE